MNILGRNFLGDTFPFTNKYVNPSAFILYCGTKAPIQIGVMLKGDYLPIPRLEGGE
jgi:hypothetical protein